MTSVRPCVVIIGGVNGSGKSTFAQRAAGTDLLLGQVAINPDELSKQAMQDMPALNDPGASLAGAEKAEKAVWRAIAEGRSVAVETVLSSDKFEPVLFAARNREYRIRLIFVALPSVEYSLERIADRVLKGGHDVPSDKVRSRWSKAHDNLVRFLALVDDVLVFSNIENSPILVAQRIGGGGTLELRDSLALPEVTRRLESGGR